MQNNNKKVYDIIPLLTWADCPYVGRALVKLLFPHGTSRQRAEKTRGQRGNVSLRTDKCIDSKGTTYRTNDSHLAMGKKGKG